MSWVRSDDTKPLSRKVRPLSDAAYRLDDQALHYCSRQLTDGLIWRVDLEEVVLGLKGKRVKEYVGELLVAGLWHDVGDHCDSEWCPAHYMPVPAGAWAKHDYLYYQPSKAEVEEKQRKRSDAGRLGGLASGMSRRNPSKAEAKREANSEANASPVASEAPAIVRNPVPSRPVPNPVEIATTSLITPPDPMLTEYLGVVEEAIGRTLSALEVTKATDWWFEFQRLRPDLVRQKLNEYIAWRHDNHKRPLTRCGVEIHDQLRNLNAHLAEQHLPPRRPPIEYRELNAMSSVGAIATALPRG